MICSVYDDGKRTFNDTCIYFASWFQSIIVWLICINLTQIFLIFTLWIMNKTKKYKCLQLTPRNSHPGVGKKIGIQGKNKMGSNVTHLL